MRDSYSRENFFPSNDGRIFLKKELAFFIWIYISRKELNLAFLGKSIHFFVLRKKYCPKQGNNRLYVKYLSPKCLECSIVVWYSEQN